MNQIDLDTSTIKNLTEIFEQGYYKKSLHESLNFLDQHKPNDIIFNIIGLSYFMLKDFKNSINFLKKSLKFNPYSANTFNNLGLVYTENKNFTLAIEMFHKSLTLDPNMPDTYCNLGNVFLYKTEYDEAYKNYKKSLALNPNCIETINNIGFIFQKINNLNEAKKLYLRGLNLNPNHSGLLMNLGNLYRELNQYSISIFYYKKCYLLNQKNEVILNNIGNLLFEKNKFKYANIFYEKALKLNPKFEEVYKNLSILQLFQCNFTTGWENFEWRFDKKYRFTNVELKEIFNNIQNKNKILIIGEQGIGDEVFFSRFISDLQMMKINPCFSLNPKLSKIIKNSFKSIKLTKKPDFDKFKYVIPIGSIAKLFITKKMDVFRRSNKYLNFDQDEIHNIRNKINTKKFLCGISWSSGNVENGKNRSIELEKLKNILNIPDVQYVNLQYGNVENELNNFHKKYGIKILNIKNIDNFNNVYSFLNLLNACDFVITIDNSTAHFAGASGKTTFLLTPKGKGKHWAWSHENTKSLWYKSIEVFEQVEFNNWDKAIDKLYLRIKKFK